MDIIINKYKELDPAQLKKALAEYDELIEGTRFSRYGKASQNLGVAVGRIGCKHCGHLIVGTIAKKCPNCYQNLI
jgi:rubrerythrin